MNILVTGGCGFVGANLLRLLTQGGHYARILDDLSTGKREYISGLGLAPEIIEGDVRSKADVLTAVDGMDGVVHLAAYTSVVDSLENPEAAWELNVTGTLNVLEACRRHACGRFVFASSNAAVGEQSPPVDENKIPRPLSPYGASKLAGEALCSGYYHSYEMRTVALRFANVYGPFSTHKSSVVAKFMGRIREGKPLTVYGDGNQTRDFVHVDDICRAIVLGLMAEGGWGEVFQIAAGRETSVNDLVEILRQVSGADIEIVHEPDRKGEIRRNYSNIGKAREMLGFEPKTDLVEGLTALWRSMA